MNLREVNMKYYRFVVFIRQDSAEIWGFRYGLALGIGTVKVMASIGVYLRVICYLKRSVSSDARTSSMILTSIKDKQSRSYQKMIQVNISPRETTHKTSRTPTENSGR
jgi:hypothetical protein